MFNFGTNWARFVEEYMTEARIAEAQKSLVDFCGGTDRIEGKTFLDIGCGSGLFSLAAHRLGAKSVVSFDLSADSTACCKLMRERAGTPENWKVCEGSALDTAFIESLGTFDFVYSWGVLHHTGDMWNAIENASTRVSPEGCFYMAIYNNVDAPGFHGDGRLGTSRFWHGFKKTYVSLPSFLQDGIDFFFIGMVFLMDLIRFKNPMRRIRGHQELRGMAWRIDMKDWLGGYPYEYATVEEIFKFMHPKGFSLESLISHNGLRNNEFLFQRQISAGDVN